MSTIEKMEIQAIRSFGPDSEDAQRISFFKPLTLILGPNGTGKTTIIECLRYATTGDFPPGGNKNGAFIHDPKLCREREIKGQVKLGLKDVTGASCIVVRSLLAKAKDSKAENITTKTMDGTICRYKPNGEKQSVTHRCVDLNREMISALGVSKAVLDNVIFCHQEDSNWPLGEAKMLKLKFDAIFDSTRYTRVLEELKKIQQTQTQDIRVGKEELKYLKEKKDKAHELKSDVEELETKLAASESSVEEVQTKLAPIKDRLEQIGKSHHEICQLQTYRQKYKTEKEQIEKSVEELKGNISIPYRGSVHQLKQELEEFVDQVQDKKCQMTSCEKKSREVAGSLANTIKEKGRLLMEVGKLQQEADTYQNNLKKRSERIKELAEEYSFEGFHTTAAISDEGCQNFFALMKGKVEESVQEAKAEKTTFEEEEKTFQGKIDLLRETKTKLEESVRLKIDGMEKNNKELKEIELKLKRLSSSAAKLDKIKADLKRAEKDLEDRESRMNCEEVKAEIVKLERQKRQLDSDISELNSEMNHLHKQSEALTQLNMLKSDQEEKMAAVERLRSIHQDSLVSLLGHMPIDDLRLSVETYKSSQAEIVEKAKSEMVSLKISQSSKEAEKAEALNQVRQKERELREKEDRIASVCSSEDYEEELGEVQKSLTQAQEEKGSLLGADHMIKKYIRALEKNNPNCPLCYRGFERAQEVRELVLKLEDTRRKVPHNMQKAEQEMETHQKKYDALMQLKPVREMISSLKDKDIPTLKSKVKKMEEELKKIKQSRENKDEDLMAKESDLEIVKGMHSDIVLMDRYKGEVRELDKKIAAQSATLSGTGSGRQLHDVIAMKESKQLELDKTNRTLDHQRDKMADYQDQVQKLRSKVNSLKGEELAIESELQQKLQLEGTKSRLSSESATYKRDIADCKGQLQPLDHQIQRVMGEKQEVQRNKEDKLAVAREYTQSIVRNGNSVKAIESEVKQYVQSGKSQKLADCETRHTKLASTQDRLEQEQEQLTGEITSLQKEIASQQVRERELQDSLQLFNKQDEIQRLDVKVQDLNKKLEGLDVKNLERERQKLMKEEEDLNKDLHRATGRQQGFKDTIRDKKNELRSDMYKDAEMRYKEQVFKTRTLEMANRDLTKYYKAMDQAVMRYHHSKMEEINRIILHLWRRTYQGNDIDTIQIRSENDDSSDSKGIKARRTYNYRVVMLRNGVAMDMRGRCSAGQKVLASLIIRLALAETFCVNCGVLALDEPTTNLDRENIESLAIALAEIIKDRHTVRHFQLVVITHDADFVELLGRADFVNQFIEVSKNDRGLSRLTTRRVEDLHTR